MQPHILLVNYIKNSIPDLKKSKFHSNMEFKSISSADELEFPASKKTPDIVVVFMQTEKRDCLNKISDITKMDLNKEVIAAIPLEMLDTGVRTLKKGAADFFLLPSAAATLDFYINRSLERNYLHRHICFNDNCYKSRYARSQKDYKQLFNEVPCFAYVVDRDLQIVDCNRKFEEYFGNHIGEYCFGILKNRDDPCAKCMVMKTFKDGKNHSSEMEIISSDGMKYVVLCWIAPIRDNSGAINKALVMLTDISEIRQLEDHLSSLGFMIGSISHGIKGLLTSLDGGIYDMEKGFETRNTERIHAGFDQVTEMTSKIKDLVLDILYYTKTRKMEWQTVSIRKFMDDILSIISNKASKNRVAIEHKLDILTEAGNFEVDENSLQASLVNILENAIEACMEKPGLPEPKIRFHVRADREKVLFTIRDNGQGMDQATVKNIFTIFFSSKGNKGTGLGLYIANKVVGQHRGSIRVKSSPEKGSKFLIKIPRMIPGRTKKPREIAYSK